MASPNKILIVMGVSGCGKSTIAEGLSKDISNAQYYDADDFHSQENKNKMHHGIPLTDQDRQPWLDSMAEQITKWSMGDAKGQQSHTTMILACSALKEKYREVLRAGLDRSTIQIIYLKGDKEEILGRLDKRAGHFMPKTLLDSQFETLEEPTSKEGNILQVNCKGKSISEIIDEIIHNPNLIAK